jgi:mono/diheme cytochrome c family protein
VNLWGLVVGGVLAGGVIAVGFKIFQPVGMRQGHSMATLDTSRLAQGDPIATVRVPSEMSPLAQGGKRVFDTKCSDCHGADAAGREGLAPPLVHKIYEPSHHGDMSFQLAVQNGVRAHHWRFGNMPPVDGLTNEDVRAIVAYVRELQRANGIN